MSAPLTREVDQFTGTTADDLIAENARLQRDNECLPRQLDALLSTDRAEMATRIQELEAERDDLLSDLADLREANTRLLTDLSKASRERDTAIAAASRRGW